MNQFEIFKSVLSGKEVDKKVVEKLQSFIFLRWLSGDRRVIGAANVVNLYNNIPENLQYKFFRKMLHGKIKYIPYPKSGKVTKVEDIELICKRYNVSLERAVEMFELVSDEELKTLRSVFS